MTSGYVNLQVKSSILRHIQSILVPLANILSGIFLQVKFSTEQQIKTLHLSRVKPKGSIQNNILGLGYRNRRNLYSLPTFTVSSTISNTQHCLGFKLCVSLGLPKSWSWMKIKINSDHACLIDTAANALPSYGNFITM